VSYFYGRWPYMLDDHRRVPVPPVFRNKLRVGVITLLPNGNLRLYAKRGKLPFSEVYQVATDDNGRIRIPSHLLLNLEKEVEWIGEGKYLELGARS